MKVVLLGARPGKRGLGDALNTQFKALGYSVDAVNRSNVDLSVPGWYEQIWQDADVYVINAYDERNPGLQLNVFNTIWINKLSRPDVSVVVIGSMCHHFKVNTPYEVAKLRLNRRVLEEGKDTGCYDCSLLFVEPGSLETLIDKKPNFGFTFMPLETAADIITRLVTLNPKFMHVALRGSLRYEPAE